MFVYAGRMVPLQRSLLGAGEPGIDAGAGWERIDLGGGSWVDVSRGFLRGADDVLDHVVARVPWSCGRRLMYDRMVDDPRLSYRCRDPDALPHPVLAQVRDALRARYRVALGPLALNYYRDGRDSVAFHRDRELREVDHALIAIVTLGARRPFLLRPLRGAGRPVARPRARFRRRARHGRHLPARVGARGAEGGERRTARLGDVALARPTVRVTRGGGSARDGPEAAARSGARRHPDAREQIGLVPAVDAPRIDE